MAADADAARRRRSRRRCSAASATGRSAASACCCHARRRARSAPSSPRPRDSFAAAARSAARCRGSATARSRSAIALAREHLHRRASSAARSRRCRSRVAVGAGLGFPVTGLIAQDLDFHAAFWFGALVSTGRAGRGLDRRAAPARHRRRRSRSTCPARVLLGGGLGAVVLAVSEGRDAGAGARTATVGLLAGGAVALAALVGASSCARDRAARRPAARRHPHGAVRQRGRAC